MRWRDQLVEESGQLFINKKNLQKTKKDLDFRKSMVDLN